MNCHDVQIRLSLYLYGELEFAEEEQLEEHLDGCALCQLAFAREKEWHTVAAIGQRDLPLDLLADCRRDLRQALQSGPNNAVAAPSRVHWWSRAWTWPAAWRITPHRWSYQTALASFLIFIGYAGGHIFDRLVPADGVDMSSLLGPGRRVSSIEPSGPNQVKIYIQHTQQREVVGSPNDERIRRILIVGAQDPLDPSVRVYSLQMLGGQTDLAVRDALLDRAERDSNAAVRLKAVQSLSAFVRDPVTRNALQSILEHDPDAAVRSQVIDLLVPASTRPQITPNVAAILRMHVLSEQDDFVRAHCLDLLRSVNAPDNSVY